MTLAKVHCGPRNGGGGQVPCLEVKSMVFHFGRWQKYRTTRDNYLPDYLPPSLPFPLPLHLFFPLPFLLFFFLVLSVLSRLCRARFKSTKSTASDQSRWISGAFHDLYNSLFLAFKKTGKVSYLDESIVVCYDLLESKNSQDLHICTVQKLLEFFVI